MDDHLMQITHVIRGEDHLSNTPRQILLYQALGWQPPVFAHHPLILAPDRSPLSKRHGATAVSQYREEGFLPEALENYLVLLGWTPPSGQETLPLDRMVEEFSIQDISRNAPIYNRKKLEWLNSFYIRGKEEAQLSEILIPYLQRAAISTDQIDRQWLNQISGVLKENLVVLSEVEQYLGIFFDEKFFFEDENHPSRSQISGDPSFRPQRLRRFIRIHLRGAALPAQSTGKEIRPEGKRPLCPPSGSGHRENKRP
jgi:glutamyl/glutaminyl-tRNA synthetase